MQHLNIHEVCERVGVQAPYFAFLDLEKHSNSSVRGRFIPEHRTGRERGSIAAAEMVRHLATLGTCAAVLEGTPRPTYYLGTKGRLKLLPSAKRTAPDGSFLAQAEVIEQDKRSLVAHSTISGDGVLAHFRCEYQVLPEAVFARTFKHYRSKPLPKPDESPYKEPIELDFETPRALSLTARSRALPASRFAGHFLEYPAWPASVYAETVTRVVDRLLSHILDREVEYSVARLDIDALRLISASEPVSFHVECVSASRILSQYVFSAQVRRDDTVATAIEMEVFV